MANRFEQITERLKGKGQVEIKQTPLRMPKELYEEYQQVCKDLGSNVNEFTVELIRLSLEEYKSDKEKKQQSKKPSKKSNKKSVKDVDQSQFSEAEESLKDMKDDPNQMTLADMYKKRDTKE